MDSLENEEYNNWLKDPTPDNLSKVIKALDPVLVTEVQHYSGPKPLLRAKAKSLAVSAVKSYDPTKGAALRSWVTTQLKPLSRYSQRMRPVNVSELASRQSAELYTAGIELEENLGREPTDEELADYVGISPKRLSWIKQNVTPTLSESMYTTPKFEGQEANLPATVFSNTTQLAADAVYKDLDEREKMIYAWKTGTHGQPTLSNAEIAARLGVTPSSITQITDRIAKRIKEVSNVI